MLIRFFVLLRKKSYLLRFFNVWFSFLFVERTWHHCNRTGKQTGWKWPVQKETGRTEQRIQEKHSRGKGFFLGGGGERFVNWFWFLSPPWVVTFSGIWRSVVRLWPNCFRSKGFLQKSIDCLNSYRDSITSVVVKCCWNNKQFTTVSACLIRNHLLLHNKRLLQHA